LLTQTWSVIKSSQAKLLQVWGREDIEQKEV